MTRTYLAMLIAMMAIASSGVARAAPPDVENRFVQLVQQQTGTTADRQTILDAAYDDVCGPMRPMTAFDLGNRLGINPITQAGRVTAIATYTGLCF
jgi:hypothetical protein